MPPTLLQIAGHNTDSERSCRDYIPRADATCDQYIREIDQERRRTIKRGTPPR